MKCKHCKKVIPKTLQVEIFTCKKDGDVAVIHHVKKKKKED